MKNKYITISISEQMLPVFIELLNQIEPHTDKEHSLMTILYDALGVSEEKDE